MANEVGHVLGKETAYNFTYDPEILAREPRVRNRQIYGFDNEHVPFAAGKDTWHAYECSFMLENGMPVNGILKMVVSADSEFIVESKSFKLYLFSFNMQRLGATRDEAVEVFTSMVQRDISKLLNSEINVNFFDQYQSEEYASREEFLVRAIPLEDYISDMESMTFETFNEDPELLQAGENLGFFIHSDLLRSNCKITHQPDWGTVFIYMYGTKGIDLRSLAQYLVSFRGENHFHEEIVECIYSRLWERYSPAELMVTALYTRRGGIDICPSRASRSELLPQQLIDSEVLTPKDYRQ